MENKMTKEETAEKIDSLTLELQRLKAKAIEKEFEIDRIIISEYDGDFKGSYVEFCGPRGYVYMKVQHQITQSANRYPYIELQGPAVRLNDSPLYARDEEDDDGIDSGAYEEHDGFAVTVTTLQGASSNKIRKITKEDMEYVLNYYTNTLKKNLI